MARNDRVAGRVGGSSCCGSLTGGGGGDCSALVSRTTVSHDDRRLVPLCLGSTARCQLLLPGAAVPILLFCLFVSVCWPYKPKMTLAQRVLLGLQANRTLHSRYSRQGGIVDQLHCPCGNSDLGGTTAPVCLHQSTSSFTP